MQKGGECATSRSGLDAARPPLTVVAVPLVGAGSQCGPTEQCGRSHKRLWSVPLVGVSVVSLLWVLLGPTQRVP